MLGWLDSNQRMAESKAVYLRHPCLWRHAPILVASRVRTASMPMTACSHRGRYPLPLRGTRDFDSQSVDW